MHFKSRRKLHRIATALFDPAHNKRQRQVVDSRAANACYLEKRSVRKRNCFILTSSFLADPVKSLAKKDSF